MTLLELVNRVMRRLREDQVGDFSEEYTKVIVELISDVHEEIMDLHDWSSMDVDVETTMVAGTRTYALAGTTAASLYRHIAGTKVFDDSSDPQGTDITVLHRDVIENMYQQDRDLTQGEPCNVSYHPDYENDTIVMTVSPTPETSGFVIRNRFFVPEPAVTTDTSVDYAFRCPLTPLRLGALYMALNERGEEMGEPGQMAQMRYYNALGTAKETDIKNRERGNEYEFYRD